MLLLIPHIILLILSVYLRSVIAIPLESQPDQSQFVARQPSAYVKYPLDHMARPSPIPLAQTQPPAPLRGSIMAASQIAQAKAAPSSRSELLLAKPVAPRRNPVINLMMTSDKFSSDEQHPDENLSNTPAARTAFFQQWRLLQRQKHPRHAFVKSIKV